MIGKIGKSFLKKIQQVNTAWRSTTKKFFSEKGQGLVEFALVIAFAAGIAYVINYTDFYASMRGAFDKTVETALTVSFDDTRGQTAGGNS